jgi:hypothetical protein
VGFRGGRGTLPGLTLEFRVKSIDRETSMFNLSSNPIAANIIYLSTRILLMD